MARVRVLLKNDHVISLGWAAKCPTRRDDEILEKKISEMLLTPEMLGLL